MFEIYRLQPCLIIVVAIMRLQITYRLQILDCRQHEGYSDNFFPAHIFFIVLLSFCGGEQIFQHIYSTVQQEKKTAVVVKYRK